MRSSKRGGGKSILPFIVMAAIAFFVFKNMGKNGQPGPNAPGNAGHPSQVNPGQLPGPVPGALPGQIGGGQIGGGIERGSPPQPLPGQRPGTPPRGGAGLTGERQVDYETTGGTVSKRGNWTVEEVDTQGPTGRPNLPGVPTPGSRTGTAPAKPTLQPGLNGESKVTRKGNWSIEEVENKPATPSTPPIPRFSGETPAAPAPSVDKVTKKGSWSVEEIDIPGRKPAAPTPRLQTPAPKVGPSVPSAPTVDKVTEKGKWKVEEIDIPGRKPGATAAPKLQAPGVKPTTPTAPSVDKVTKNGKWTVEEIDIPSTEVAPAPTPKLQSPAATPPTAPKVDKVTKKGQWKVEDIDIPDPSKQAENAQKALEDALRNLPKSVPPNLPNAPKLPPGLEGDINELLRKGLGK